ncbi:hypothetical protein F2Q70_00015850 [Brassica cretica]|uniref:Uncharacterized protein n=1 Tax=Brassica cretica TaxID=69181 RepID=A0A8S9I149_BRACR|nr:hypothetical protein F2Q70_00015850 [Brassica cretica]
MGRTCGLGTPHRHLLTIDWSTFTNQKKVIVGDLSAVCLVATAFCGCVGGSGCVMFVWLLFVLQTPTQTPTQIVVHFEDARS